MPKPSRSLRKRVENRVSDGGSALADFLREEATGGKLLLGATALALLWANLAGDAYDAVWGADLAVGPAWLELDLTLGDWVQDGLLALFFFVAGLELKRELTVGELAGPRAAALPLFAAAGGIVVPALVVLVIAGGAAGANGAWAIPVATDIAFALGVLALVGSALPTGVRVLLLSMAVIDDLAAIALIAVLFAGDLALGWLAGGLALCGLYGLAQRRRLDSAALLWTIAVAAWVCIHASGVHATVAGVLLALLTPVRALAGEDESPVERLEHRLHPISAGFVVPLFAVAAAGVPLAAAGAASTDALAIGIFAGLLAGKTAGILGGARLSVGLGLGELPAGVRWGDVVPVAVLGAIGFTVSLLIARLSLADPAAQDAAAAAILAASALASAIALLLLRRRAAVARAGPG